MIQEIRARQLDTTRFIGDKVRDIQAAVGLVQLTRLDEAVARRRELAQSYRDAFADVPGLRCVQDPPDGTTNVQSFWVELDPTFPMTRDELLAHLAERDVSARRGIMAAHRQPAYAGMRHAPLPVTERLTDSTLILPVFHEMTADETRRVVDAVLDAARVAV